MASPPHDHGPEMSSASSLRLRDCLHHGIGPVTVSGECRQCKVDRQLLRIRGLKRRAIEFLGGACMECGYNRCPDALDFHHRDPATKEFGITKRLGKSSWYRISIELLKCDLLCCNCHRTLHHNTKNQNASTQCNARKKLRALEYLGGSCEDCGYNACPAALEFHHRDPSQKIQLRTTPTSLTQAPWEMVRPELDKCDLKCSNCHREHHHEQSQSNLERALQ